MSIKTLVFSMLEIQWLLTVFQVYLRYNPPMFFTRYLAIFFFIRMAFLFASSSDTPVSFEITITSVF